MENEVDYDQIVYWYLFNYEEIVDCIVSTRLIIYLT